jgi:hypothetical protein
VRGDEIEDSVGVNGGVKEVRGDKRRDGGW